MQNHGLCLLTSCTVWQQQQLQLLKWLEIHEMH